MKKLGFADGCVQEEEISPVHFYFQNVPKFLELMGVSFNKVVCGVRNLRKHDDVVIHSIKREISLVHNGGLLNPKNVLNIEIDSQFLAVVMDGDQSLLLGKLWYYLATSVRLWQIQKEKIGVHELVPAKLLYEIPDTKDMITEFMDAFEEKIFDEFELAHRFDAAIVGFHVAELMCSDESLVQSISPVEIAELIATARCGNWKKLTARH